jgi:predicted ABC-type transport system involved in lysophospholipase L1 biosynthesis ATPase subunit
MPATRALDSLRSPALVVRGLAHGFHDPEGGRVEVLDLPELVLARGEALAVTGPSGSGKTTLLHLVAGLLAADRGTIEVAGEAMTGRGESARDRLRARHVGIVFLAFHLLPGLTALENVALGMTFRPRGAVAPQAAAREALQRVGLADRLHHRPGQLSTGQQQRVAIARALAGKPTLVLADEPTASLDAPRAAACLDLLLEFAREAEAALLLVTHDPTVLERFPRRLTLATPTGARA